MKKIKMMSFVAAAMLVLGANVAGAQTIPEQQNTITRSACLPQYLGCYSGNITLNLLAAPIGGDTHTYGASGVFAYSTRDKKIKVTVDGYTSTGTYYLPTNVGDQTVIFLGANGEGVGPYAVFIAKTGDQQFTLSASNNAL